LLKAETAHDQRPIACLQARPDRVRHVLFDKGDNTE
jgi:hypothetical protein